MHNVSLRGSMNATVRTQINPIEGMHEGVCPKAGMQYIMGYGLPLFPQKDQIVPL
jgi:hypothetical protein